MKYIEEENKISDKKRDFGVGLVVENDREWKVCIFVFYKI